MRRSEAANSHGPDQPEVHRAKLGFSYTYFTWRNARDEIESCPDELHTAPPRGFFRSHFERPPREWDLPDDGVPCAADLIGGRAFDWRRKLQSLTLMPAAPYGIGRVRAEREL